MDPKHGEPGREDDDDTTVEDVLAGFNAEEIVDDPVGTESKHADEPPAATPDSPNPI